jgi:hypothetical protein
VDCAQDSLKGLVPDPALQFVVKTIEQYCNRPVSWQVFLKMDRKNEGILLRPVQVVHFATLSAPVSSDALYRFALSYA